MISNNNTEELSPSQGYLVLNCMVHHQGRGTLAGHSRYPHSVLSQLLYSKDMGTS